MKRLIAFSSVAHMGFVMLGIATLTDFGLNAAVFGMVAHGLITGMLFFLAGSVKERYHTLEIKRLGGLLAAGAPAWAGSSASASMASLGLPGLAGFWGEFPAILSAYNPAAGLSEETVPHLHGDRRRRHGASPPATCCGSTSAPRSARPRRSSPTSTSTTCTSPSGSPGSPMLVLILVLGIFPNLIFHVTDPARDRAWARPSRRWASS